MDLPVFHLVVANYYTGLHIFQRRYSSQLRVDTHKNNQVPVGLGTNCNVLQHKSHSTGFGQFLRHCYNAFRSCLQSTTCQLLTVADSPCQLVKFVYQHELHHKTEGFMTSILNFP